MQELSEGESAVKELAANRRKALSRGREGPRDDEPIPGKLTTSQLQQLLHMHAATWKTEDLSLQFKLNEESVAAIVKHYSLLRAEEEF